MLSLKLALSWSQWLLEEVRSRSKRAENHLTGHDKESTRKVRTNLLLRKMLFSFEILVCAVIQTPERVCEGGVGVGVCRVLFVGFSSKDWIMQRKGNGSWKAVRDVDLLPPVQ